MQILFFELIKSVIFVIQCGSNFFELIKTVMGINSLAGLFFFFEITDVVFFFFFEPSSPHNSQRIAGNQQHNEDNTYQHKLTHTNTTKHNTHFQHRHRPTSFQVARGLHSYARTVVSCMSQTGNGPKPTHTDTQGCY